MVKLATKATGADQLFLKAFPSGTFHHGSVESDVAWTVKGDLSESTDTSLDRVALLGGANAVWSVDEIRIGKSWRSVAGENIDCDALDDAWEMKYFGNLTSTDGSGDMDQDGMTEAEEQTAGTNPLNAASNFRLSLQREDDGLSLTWPSTGSRSYDLLSRPEVTGGAWSIVQAGIAATPPVNVFPQALARQSLFYRVMIE